MTIVNIKNPKAGSIPHFEHTFPAGFIVVIDTRETNQLFKRPPKGLVIVRDTLPSGDYSIRGFENSIAIERKNMVDLYLSLGKERERFKRELERLQQFERKWIFVEGSHEEALRWQEYSQMHPNAVRQSIISIEIRYGIPFYFCSYRRWLERHMIDLFIKYYNVKRNG